ncbi:type VI secretion system tip protein VgrG [Pontibacter pamirensis]|uniref:type VI secretion system tip protein VgrG n=1 Tax=Pontibacter pamirensis TaxID=2562824 RepID=UPI00138A3289|nr:type VI secretion system tip protein VgrG [Pontibacter pamirensis]
MEELLIPNASRHDVVSFTILVNETALDPSYEILSLSITKEVNRVPLARLVIRDGNASERNFEISNEDTFIPGNKIKIKLGLDGNNTQVFKGIILKHAIKVRANGNTELKIECRDEAVKMTVGRHNQYYQNLTDSQLFDVLIGRYKGLKSDPAPTVPTHKAIVQHHVTDWDFMLLRAEANGMLVLVEDGTIKVAQPNSSATPVLQVTYGSSVLEFEAEMDAQTQFKSVKAFSWDHSNQKLFDADASAAASFAEHGNIKGSALAGAVSPENIELQHSGNLPEQELQEWVDGMMLRSRLSKIRGRAKVTGYPGIKPGDMVKLAGVGDRFNGKAFVTAVRHDVGNGTWDTHIQFGLDPERYARLHPDTHDLLGAGLVGAIHGLQIGKVVQLENDPAGEDRILVKVPVIDNTAQGIWSRVASLDAGANRGAFFRPEIDDEVLVGFLNDDPRHAVVLGMLHSSAKPAPLTAQNVNHKKGFTTRSGMHLQFDDASNTITIDTPAGNSIKLDEQGQTLEIKDQNLNKVTLEPSGIKLESPLNVEIKAGVNLTLSAGASLTIGGTTLSVKADGNVGIEGAFAKLSAQGITEISGSLVKIN